MSVVAAWDEDTAAGNAATDENVQSSEKLLYCGVCPVPLTGH